MKTTLTILSLVFALAPAFAAEEGFEAHKAKALTEIDEHIAKMQEHKSCVSAATTPEALKKCHQTMKAYHQAERMEHMEMRKEHLEKRMGHMKQKQTGG